MMWMLQYVKGGDNLADMVVDGRIILKCAWRSWNAGAAWAYPARSRLQWCMHMKKIMNLRVPYKDGYSWPADRLSSSLKELFSAEWQFTMLPIQMSVKYPQPCTVRSRLPDALHHACAEVKFGHLLPSNAPQEARHCLHPYDGIKNVILQLTI
jgi:hypothetical protein